MKTMINIKADKDTKKDAQKVANDLGLTLSAIINAYLKQFVRNKAVYFSTASRMTQGLESLLGQTEKDYKVGKDSSPVFSDTEKMIKYLRSK